MDCSAVIAPPRNALLAKPPPLWFVTDGDVTVGPVTTNLLVRGVFHRRIPDYCLVRERTSKAWRKLERIREVAALKHAQARDLPVFVEPVRWRDPATAHDPFERMARELRAATDPEDGLRVCLLEAMRVTGSLVGAVHRRTRSVFGFVTACVSGPGMARRLGRPIDDADPAFVLAHQGLTLSESPKMGTPSDHVSCRLGALASSGGIAMAPIVSGGHLYAVMEVGRPDHEFRREDFNRLVTITGMAAERVGTVQNHLTRSRFPHLAG